MFLKRLPRAGHGTQFQGPVLPPSTMVFDVILAALLKAFHILLLTDSGTYSQNI